MEVEQAVFKVLSTTMIDLRMDKDKKLLVQKVRIYASMKNLEFEDIEEFVKQYFIGELKGE